MLEVKTIILNLKIWKSEDFFDKMNPNSNLNKKKFIILFFVIFMRPILMLL